MIAAESEEAVPERDPWYERQEDEETEPEPPTLSREEAWVWERMCQRRPALSLVREAT